MRIQPLAQSRAEQSRFVDRDAEIRTVLRAVASTRPVLVLGQRGSGRTSLLNRIAWLLARQEQPRESVLVSGDLVADPAQLLGLLVARVGRLPERRRAHGDWLDDLRALSAPDGPFGEVVEPAILMELVDLLAERIAELDRPVCLMVDGVAPTVAHRAFGSLRNELWALEGASWIVTGDSADEDSYLEPPADAFFEEVVELGALTHSDASKLLHAHAPELSEDVAERAIRAGQGNPRRLLRGATEIEVGREPEDLATDELARQAVDVGGQVAGPLVEYIAEYGPSAASDRRLLRRIGISRQRASQIMHELESAGILRTVEQRASGERGRPARRFTLVAPE